MNLFGAIQWLFLKAFVYNTKYYISNKTNATYSEKDKPFDKKVITISQAGYYGYYVMGVCDYIKEHYDTSAYVFSGASAGSWMSLFMTYKGPHKTIAKLLIDNKMYKNASVAQLLQIKKQLVLTNFKSEDFDLDRAFVAVTTFGMSNIHTDFVDLEDALDCCLASSHIPLITGPLLNSYKNRYAFDGGVSESPYLTGEVLHLHPNIWGRQHKQEFKIYKKDYDLEELYRRGYEDTKEYGKETLDRVLL